jgi:hypothetical protein
MRPKSVSSKAKITQLLLFTYVDEKSKASPYKRKNIWLLLYENVDHFGVLVDRGDDIVNPFMCYRQVSNTSAFEFDSLVEEIIKATG